MEFMLEHAYTSAGAHRAGSAPSSRVRQVASMFGLGLDAEHMVTVLPMTKLPLPMGGVVFVTGPSGGGKSTLLRCLHRAVLEQGGGLPVLDFSTVGEVDDQPLIDALPTDTLEDALRLLSLAGLNDAFVMLRRPSELSDGQRYRFALAQVMAAVEALPESDEHQQEPRALVLADEFGAALDRVTAMVVARNVSKWARRSGVCAVLATTHDDLLEALSPEVLVEQGLGGRIVLHRTSDLSGGGS